MALIKCNECKCAISSKAKNCPQCGAPLKKGGCSSCLGVIVVAFLAAIALPKLSNTRPNNSDHKVAPTSMSEVKPKSSRSQGSSNFFDDPQSLAVALTTEGLGTDGWKASVAIPGEWLCMTPLTPFGGKGTGALENNIAFYVHGTSYSRANDIRIKININNPNERDQAFLRLAKATKRLFEAIGESVPTQLVDALAKQKPVSINTSFGKVEMLYEPGNIDSFKVVLTDARFLAEKTQAHNSSALEFEVCKKLVAKAAGYSGDLLSGDGEPIQEDGYRSFMFKGRGKDLFFCEIHSEHRFKIKAALNGVFPFRYIAEGHY